MALTELLESGVKISNAPSDGKYLQYKDSTDKLTWADATAVGGATGVDFNDDVKIRFGTGNDAYIGFDITNDTADTLMIRQPDGEIHIKADNFMLLSDDTAGRAIYLDDGNDRLELGHDGTADAYFNGGSVEFVQDVKFDGATAGTDITFDRSDNALEFADDAKATFGDSADLLIYHSSGDNILSGPASNTAVPIKIQPQANEVSAVFKDTSVDLYYANVKKAETVTGGFTVTGTCTATAFAGDGSNLTGLSSGTALTGSTDNTICTVTGANAIQGEANLTFNGSQLDLDTGSGTFNRWKTDQLRFNSTGTAHIDHYTTGQAFKFRVSGSSAADTTAFEIFSTGNVEVSSGNLVIGTAGKGIDFSASADSSADGQSTDSELLDEYEEGEWEITPNNNNLTFTNPDCRYTKIGNLVTCVGKIDVNSVSGTDLTYLYLPFTCAHVANYGNASASAMIHTQIDAGGDTCGLFIPGNTAAAWMFGSQNDGGWRHISNSHLSSSSEMVFTFSYRTT